MVYGKYDNALGGDFGATEGLDSRWYSNSSASVGEVPLSFRSTNRELIAVLNWSFLDFYFFFPRQMLKEFCSLTGAEEDAFVEAWCKYTNLSFKYAPLEAKKSVKILLAQYLLEEDSDEGTFTCSDVTLLSYSIIYKCYTQIEQQYMPYSC